MGEGAAARRCACPHSGPLPQAGEGARQRVNLYRSKFILTESVSVHRPDLP
ncbi:hypothetical protein GLE_4685 [Lysobacter enzymogenes]|uniref:Uncharacterized protein n=1 Tax=Lysobacter enzymogenes TaxID=69 RepID=A0A0S2DN72_LYSEN|nr:hypothetical protein GLE_4685 [Lysobacter enzymogenes]